MIHLKERDKEFIEKVIEQNKNGLMRLAEEKDAEEKRSNYITMKIRDFYREILGLRDNEGKKFTKIEMN